MFSEIYLTAQDAFEDLYKRINLRTTSPNGTRRMNDVSIMILNPYANEINTEFRGWSKSYANREWQWYLSKNRSVEDLKKYAPIWDKMHNGDNIVNSNYGFLWDENNQLDNIIDMLTKDPLSRRAWITIYDGKNWKQFEYDTPCTLNIGFSIEHGFLCMKVLMRSNDLWYGFCNDQYCFSELQKVVADKLKLDIGHYYHYAADMHLYSKHFDIV